MNKNTKWKVLITVALVALAIWKLYPPKKTIKLGLDLKGGMYLTLQVDMLKYFENKAVNVDEKFQIYVDSVEASVSPTQEDLLLVLEEKADEQNIELRNYFPDYLPNEKYRPNNKILEEFWSEAIEAPSKAVEIIRRRIDAFGVAEPVIQTEGKNRIVVQLPGIKDKERAKEQIGKTALLEFKLVNDDLNDLAKIRKGISIPGYEILPTQEGGEFLVERRAKLTGGVIKNVMPSQTGVGEPVVNFTLDGKGTKIFALVTEQNVGKRLAIILDDEIIMAPVIKEAIRGGSGQISGHFTQVDAQDLGNLLKYGSLPAPVYIIDDRTVSPTLGKDSVRKGILAGIIGLILVALFMAIYYLINGLIADFALCLNMLFIFAALAWFNATLTLPGIAGIILTIGMAVDANVLINERIREESSLGKKIGAAVAAGYDKAFLTILDANLTTLFAAGVLLIFGSGPVKGFAVTLSIGIIASMFTAIVVTRIVLDFILGKKTITKLPMLQFFKATKINFLNKKNIAYILSIILIGAGITAAAIKGKDCLGIDFTGGQLVQVQFQEPNSISEIRSSLKDVGLGSSYIQGFRGNKDYIFRTQSGAVKTIEQQLRTSFSDKPFIVMRTEEVGPVIGAKLRRQALIALALAMLIMIAYISYRFEFKFAAAGIIAIFHDIAIATGLCILTGRQLSLPIIAALLAIIGYSINDTIVIYDRIREDKKLMPKSPFKDIVNTSINQTLSRTLLTSLTTLIVLVCLYFFGGEVINDFAFAMLIGVITGTYSTIFVASALVSQWHK